MTINNRFEGIRAVGFDMDQTLYPDLPQVKLAVREQFYELIAEKNKWSIEKATEAFESAYDRLKASGKAFVECNISNPREAVRDCMDRAKAHRFLTVDPALIDMMTRLRKHYQLFLITDGRLETTILKIKALGLSTELFQPGLCWDLTPDKYSATHVRKDDGSAFQYVERCTRFTPRELLYVGNSEGDDIIPPANRGWRTIYVSDKPSTVATATVKRVHDIAELLL